MAYSYLTKIIQRSNTTISFQKYKGFEIVKIGDLLVATLGSYYQLKRTAPMKDLKLEIDAFWNKAWNKPKPLTNKEEMKQKVTI